MADPKKVEVIVNLPPPKDSKGVQKVLGHTGYYRELIEDYATKALPLINLTKKDVKFDCTAECQKGYNELKMRLTSALVLRVPNWNKPFHVYCDASAVAIGSTLSQVDKDTGPEHPIVFASCQLS